MTIGRTSVGGLFDLGVRCRRMLTSPQSGHARIINRVHLAPIVSAQLTLWSVSVRYKICRGFDRCA